LFDTTLFYGVFIVLQYISFCDCWRIYWYYNSYHYNWEAAVWAVRVQSCKQIGNCRG